MSQPREGRILLFQEFHKLYPRSANPARRLKQPAALVSTHQYRTVEIELVIKQENGNPTDWSLKPRPELIQISSSGFQDTNPFFQPLTVAQANARCSQTGWLPDLTKADFPGGLPAGGKLWTAVMDAVPHFFRVDLGESGDNAFTISGGTNPNLQISLAAYGKVN